MTILSGMNASWARATSQLEAALPKALGNPLTTDQTSGARGCGHWHHQSDSVLLNGNSSDPAAAQIRALRRSHALRKATDAQVDRMLVTRGVASATPEDAAKIRDELSRMDPAVLKALADKGTTIRVLGPDENLYEAGLLRPISETDFSQNLQADKSRIGEAQQAVSHKYDAKIQEAQAQVARLRSSESAPTAQGPAGFFGTAPQSQELTQAYAELARLRALKDSERATQTAEASGGRWMEYDPGALWKAQSQKGTSDSGDVGTAPMMMQHQAALLSRSSSLDQMAAAHGLTDPDQAKVFKDQVYAMNQERIDAALARLTADLSRTAQGTGKEAEEARQRLAQAQAYPSSVPILIDPDQPPLLVPNSFVTTVRSQGQDQAATMTMHDVAVYHDWSGQDGKSSNMNILGQYFHENGRSEVLVRREQLGQPASARYTLTHEMGHAVENALKSSSQLSPSFEPRLRDSYETATPHGYDQGWLAAVSNPMASSRPRDPERRAISFYAETSSNEFFAEGYAAFVHDPERLKSMDARLFGLIAEANKALGGR